MKNRWFNILAVFVILSIAFLLIPLPVLAASSSDKSDLPQLGGVIISPSLVAGNTEIYSDKSYQSELLHIQRLRDTKNLNGLVELANSVQRKWGTGNDLAIYYGLMEDITTAISSNDFGYNAIKRQNILAVKYVMITLNKGPVPVDIAIHLLPCLLPQIISLRVDGKVTDQQWSVFRKQYASLWLQSLELLKTRMLPNYDFTTPIAANAVSHERSIQFLLRGILQQYKPYAVQLIVDLYTQKPSNTQELSALLNKYHADSDLIASIMAAVNKNTANSQGN
jgi:hypothetical protein